MRFDVLSLILGWTLIAISIPLLICGVITVWLDDLEMALRGFLIPLILSPMIGFLMLKFGTRSDTPERLRDREAFAAVALIYPIVVFIGLFPYWLGGVFVGPFASDAALIDIARGGVNSWFESMSGFTTTGATVISHDMSPNCIPGQTPDCINAQPRGILLWRSLTQWLGGMGIIMLGMMLLSRVMGGGMALARAELTGPSLSRLRPKVKETAFTLWKIYIGFTFIEIFLLGTLGGMSLFDSVNHGFTTMATGGFSTRDASIGYYDSLKVEAIIIIFMFIGGINFTLIWFLLAREFVKAYKDEEFKTYLVYILVAVSVMMVALVTTNVNLGDSFRQSLFQTISIGTSTGYTTQDYMTWPAVTHFILMILMIVGACAGSTSGGLKLMRIILAFKVAMRELVRIAQPRKIKQIRMNGGVVEPQQIDKIVGMLFVWIGLFGIASILLSVLMFDESFESIIGITASSLGNTGPALGDYGPSSTWSPLNSGVLILTSILMWFGRLELLTVIILLHPKTWQEEHKEHNDRSAIALFRKLIPGRK